MSVHPWTVLPALMTRLDECLAAAVPHAQARFGVGPGADPYRGLYVGDELVERLVTQPLHQQPLGSGAWLDWPELRPGLGPEALDPFETAVAVLALAPELDLKYERIYGYLQDDVNARRPRVALALDLFCPDLQSRLDARDRFSPDAPMRRRRIVSLGGSEDAPLLARPFRLDPQTVRHLIGGTGLDERLAERCELLMPDPVNVPIPLQPADRARLQGWAESVRAGHRVRVVLSGADLAVLEQLAVQLSDEVELPVLRMTHDADAELLTIVAAESRLLGCAVHLEWRERESWSPAQVLGTLEHAGVLVVVTTDGAANDFEGFGFDVAEIARPSAALRREWWERSAPGVSDSDLDRLAARYRLTGSQITAACRAVQVSASRDDSADFAELAAAARRQAAHRLDAVTERIPTLVGWDDLVLPDASMAAIRELCDRVIHRHTVFRQWGMDVRTNGRLGINALFAGSSGTGKTMAAQVVAAELGLDLFAIDLSGVVSKYIGETEKNLDAIFSAAENTDAVLLFDEADALFGKRSEVRDSHDRYANLEISYLLQRMESHDGVAILATNLQRNLDDAFLRRLAFTIRFPFPEEAERRRIWSKMWPPAVPLAEDIDLDLLASRYKFSGGNIRNVAVCAAFLAASGGGIVTFADVLDAVDREFEKLGGGTAPKTQGLSLAGSR